MKKRSVTYKITRFVIGQGNYTRELYSVTDLKSNRKVRQDPWPYASRTDMALGIARHHTKENGGNITLQSTGNMTLTFHPSFSTAPNKTEKPLDEKELRKLEREILFAVEGLKMKPMREV